MKIVLISDLHYPANPLTDIFLLRAVHRINRYLKPDLVLLAGDLLHKTARAEDLGVLAEILQKLTVPYIAVPGNHDPSPEIFYRYLPRPAEFTDILGWRLIPFTDAETLDHNARLPESAFARLRRLTAEAPGAVVTLSHCPLFPPDAAACPFNYADAEKILQLPISLTLAGHYHRGLDCQAAAAGRTVRAYATPALYKPPFPYSVLELPDNPRPGENAAGKIRIRHEPLRAGEGFCDTHVHTRFAYCSEPNWDAERLFALAEAFGVRHFAFTEHSGHLYTNYAEFRNGTLDRDGIARAPGPYRYAEYAAYLDSLGARVEFRGRFARGLEVDVGAHGEIILREEDARTLLFRIGAVHHLVNVNDLEAAKNEFLFRCEALCRYGVKILAHPFRVFRKKMKCEPPAELFAPLAKMLKDHGVAAEINYHGNTPEPEFFALCHQMGVPLTCGSDTHNLYEIGEFYANFRLLAEIGMRPEELYRLSVS